MSPSRCSPAVEEPAAARRSSSPPKADYEAISKYYDEVRPGRPETLAPWVEALAAILGGQKGGTLLDVGAGTGRFVRPMEARCGASVIGLDASPGMLHRAISKDPLGLWVLGDAQALPIRPSAVDGAFMVMVLQHLADGPAAIRELYRVVRPDGRAVAITSSWARLAETPVGLFPGVRRLDRARFPSIPSVCRWFREAGFDPVGVRYLRIEVRGARVEEVVERVRRRYISTFALMDDEELARGLPVFERRLRERYGPQFDYVNTFAVVWGGRPKAVLT